MHRTQIIEDGEFDLNAGVPTGSITGMVSFGGAAPAGKITIGYRDPTGAFKAFVSGLTDVEIAIDHGKGCQLMASVSGWTPGDIAFIGYCG